MGYVLGMDVGVSLTAHATVPVDGPLGSGVGGGVVRSVVALSAEGVLLAGGDVATAGSSARAVTAGFVERLGDPTPVMISGTPYGVEALIGQLVSSILRASRTEFGASPDAVVFAHADGVGEYRTGLLTEAARLAGVPLTLIATVSHSDALSALNAAGLEVADELQIATGAALVVRDRRAEAAAVAPDPSTGIGTSGVIAGGAAATAGGAVFGASVLGDATAAAPGTTAGVGYTGTPLTAPGTGYTGTPLTTPGTGYTGTPLNPPGTGYEGKPLNPPGSGYEGTPLTTADADPVAPGSAKVRSRRLPLIIAAVAVVVVGAGTAIALTNSSDSSSAPATTSPLVIDTIAATNPTDTTDTTDTTGTIAATDPTFDPAVAAPPTTAPDTSATCAIGTWTIQNDSIETIFEQVATAYWSTFNVALDFTGLVAGQSAGGAQLDIAADGTWTLTYGNWATTLAGPAGSIINYDHSLGGVEVSQATLGDDGSITFSSISTATRATLLTYADGRQAEIDQFAAPAALTGTGSFICSGNQLSLQLDASPKPIVMDRAS